jgi:hypothetical protein
MLDFLVTATILADENLALSALILPQLKFVARLLRAVGYQSRAKLIVRRDRISSRYVDVDALRPG